jgi:hypothetical protein
MQVIAQCSKMLHVAGILLDNLNCSNAKNIYGLAI